MAAAAAGSQLDDLFVPESDGWTGYATSESGPAVARVVITLAIVVASVTALAIAEFRSADDLSEQTGPHWRMVIVALVLPILATTIRELATSDVVWDWVWFVCAAAMTAVITGCALLVPDRGGLILAAGLAVAGAQFATVGSVFDPDSWWPVAVPLAALIAGALLSRRRRRVYPPLAALGVLSIVGLVAGEDVGGSISVASTVLTSISIGYLISSVAAHPNTAAVAIGVPAISLFTLPFTVYSAGYAPLGDPSADFVTNIVPSEFSMGVTGACMLAVAIATVAIIRRREPVA